VIQELGLFGLAVGILMLVGCLVGTVATIVSSLRSPRR